jgi:hypothetical protein
VREGSREAPSVIGRPFPLTRKGSPERSAVDGKKPCRETWLQGRGIGVQPNGPNKWKWATYPKIGSGITAKRGKASAESEAVAACKAAIEQAFQKRALR